MHCHIQKNYVKNKRYCNELIDQKSFIRSIVCRQKGGYFRYLAAVLVISVKAALCKAGVMTYWTTQFDGRSVRYMCRWLISAIVSNSSIELGGPEIPAL